MSNITGQSVFTASQEAEILNRLNNPSGLFMQRNSNPTGFFQCGEEFLIGAESILDYYNRSVAFPQAWTFMTSAIPVPEDNSAGSSSPVALNAPGGISLYNIEYIHMAASLAYLWRNDSTVQSFDGVNQARSQHALDIADAVFHMLMDRVNDNKLDWSNTAKFLRNSMYINGPIFQSIAKMTKYIDSYSFCAIVLGNSNSYFNSNWQAAEDWFQDCYDYCLNKIEYTNNEVFGNIDPAVLVNSCTSTSWNQQSSSFPHVYYNSSGTGQLSANLAQFTGVANRVWDLIGYIGHYGLMFNNQTAESFAENMFYLTIKLGVYPDGTWFEWGRGRSASPNLGANYVPLSLFHITKLAYSHAVAVQNGLAGAGTNAGKYFDYTTSEGSDDLYSGGWATASTSGGTKGLKLMHENHALHYKTSANGGYIGVRYGGGGGDPETLRRANWTATAMANTYYDDIVLEDAYMQRTSANYNGPRYYQDSGSPSLLNNGPYHDYALTAGWGGSSVYGGYLGLGLMESFVFDGSINPPVNQNILFKKKNLWIY